MSETVKEAAPTDGAKNKEENANCVTAAPRSPTPQQFKNPVTFKECFKAFSKFGDTKSDGKFLTLSQSDKWMKQAKIIDGKKVTTTDTAIYFKKLKQQKLNLADYEKFLAELCKSKNLNIEDIKKQMGGCGAPGLTTTSAGSKVPNAFERLTDASKYTGSHKLRFDESGKGKGIEGRKDLPNASGYVHGYQNKDSYNKTH